MKLFENSNRKRLTEALPLSPLSRLDGALPKDKRQATEAISLMNTKADRIDGYKNMLENAQKVVAAIKPLLEKANMMVDGDAVCLFDAKTIPRPYIIIPVIDPETGGYKSPKIEKLIIDIDKTIKSLTSKYGCVNAELHKKYTGVYIHFSKA